MARRGSPSPRALAVRILRDIESRRGYSNRILAEHLERHDPAPRDRGLVTTLVYGVLRHRGRLDHLIDHFARRPSAIAAQVREVLRVAAFELRELDRPIHVVAAEAKTMAMDLDPAGSVARFVQAIVTAIDREGAAVDEAAAHGKPIDALARRWSIPRWLAGGWIKRLGPERALARATALATVPPVDLRIDLSRVDADTVEQRLLADHPTATVRRVPDQPQALRVRGAGDLFYGPLSSEGLVSIQGLAAQQPALRLGARPGQRILDACAGRGVKTRQLAELMHHRGTLVASDRNAGRLEAIEQMRGDGQLGPAEFDLHVVTADLTATAIDALGPEPFDAALVDAPCSGLGNLRRHPEIRWHRQFEDIAAHHDVQRGLLRAAAGRVRPGGTVVYAVCSLEPAEGEAIVETVTREGGLRIVGQEEWTPETHDTEGFFLAVLEA